MRSLFAFPNPVNEKAARVVAGTVFAISIVALVTGAYWLLAVLAYGFIARVLTGPTLSPLGRLATSVLAPRMGEARPVPGPPKRFAQGIGAVLTTTGAICVLAGASSTVAIVLLAPDDRGRGPRVDPRLLHRLPAVRPLDAGRADSGVGL